MKMKFILFLIMCTGIIGCRTQQQFVPIESSSVDSTSQKNDLLIQRMQSLINEIRVWEHRRDSISAYDSVSLRDSTIIYINEAGDVISKERYRDRVQKSDKASSTESNKRTEITQQYIDSLFVSQKIELLAILEQSQQIPIPVERQLTKWEQVKKEVGGTAIEILIVIVVIAVIWLIKKIKNQK